jgi:hypothetical protein
VVILESVLIPGPTTLRVQWRRQPVATHGVTTREGHREGVMGDLLYLGLTAVFFWLTWLLVRLCERL